ncbi:MAG: sigma 54-interacting transcriptional regulator [Alicyclobacillus sp.]|nr:sigma 54-interacting transcriptional regulator [Alicyclobacillus sp.]
MSEIVVYAPYPNLADIAAAIRVHRGHSVSVCAVQSRELSQRPDLMPGPDARVLVSRGGTAKLLRSRTSLPVIEIQVTAYDVLRAVSDAARAGCRRVALITPANIMLQADHFVDVTDLSLRIESCDDVQRMPALVRDILQTGEVDAVIGDRVATDVAQAGGVHGFLLESGRASLLIALDAAADVLEAQIAQQTRLKETESILNLIREAVITTHADGRVARMNQAAAQILGIERNSGVGRRVEEVAGADLAGPNAKENAIVEVGGKAVVLNRVPVVIQGRYRGSVCIFEEVQQIQNTELSIRRKLYERGFVAKRTLRDIAAVSPRMRQLVQLAERYAKSDGTVLVRGETGTGKELIAQGIHNASRRQQGPFVSVNCAAIDGDLLNSELFGYEEGAFTGAARGGRPGLFELAHGGTLFLDEISETSLAFQSKLLRVIQEREIRRVGGSRMVPVDVRIICATNRDLTELVAVGKFREDLLYRLNVLELQLPPLRERREDIVPMAQRFLQQEREREGRPLAQPDAAVLEPLLAYHWPGNVRELQNIVHRMVVCCESEVLTRDFVAEMLPSPTSPSTRLAHAAPRSAVGPSDAASAGTPAEEACAADGHSDVIAIPVIPNWPDMERAVWQALLTRYGGNRDRLCEAYGISKTTLWRKLNRR